MAFTSKKKRRIGQPVLEEMIEDDYTFDKPKNRFEELTNHAYEKFSEAPFKDKLRLRYEYRKQLIRAVYHDTDPKEIPASDLKIMMYHTSDDFKETKYFERAKSPITAVRAYCMNCQSHSIASVRNCTNAVCALFPFRMGNNPFYGKLADADAEATEDFNEEEITGAEDADTQAHV